MDFESLQNSLPIIDILQKWKHSNEIFAARRLGFLLHSADFVSLENVEYELTDLIYDDIIQQPLKDSAFHEFYEETKNCENTVFS